MESNKEPKANSEPESSVRKDCLIKALAPLCNDFPWLNDLIISIKTAPLIETDFEISGLARNIVYKLINANPKLFENDDMKTLPLKNIIIQLVENIEVLKNRKENIAKAIKEVYLGEAKKVASRKIQSKL